jgi:transposase-like protein
MEGQVILEQDHRAIKRRVNAKQGFREFQAARRTIQGYEAMNMIGKGKPGGLAGLAFKVATSDLRLHRSAPTTAL